MNTELRAFPRVAVAFFFLLSGQWVLVKPNSTVSLGFSLPGDWQTQGCRETLNKPEYQAS